MNVPIARLFGIEIRVSWVWALLIAIVTLLGAEQAGYVEPTLATPVHWILGFVVAITFLATVVAHELAHALVGRRHGVPASRITLDFAGGLAPMSIQAERPRDELLIAVAGPLVSLTVAGVALGLALATGTAGSAPGLLGGGLVVVGGLNLALALLSLLPGMPLDGGRIVRAVAWAGTGDRDRAGRVTASLGRVIGWALVGAGVVAAVADLITVGMLMLALGWILATGAGTLAGRANLERLLKGATVADATVDDVPRIPPGLTVDTFADRFSGEGRVSCLPVVDGDAVLGVIGARTVRRLTRGRLATARAMDIMQVPPAAPFLAPTDDLWSAVDAMSRLAVDGLAVVDDGTLVGVVMRESIGRLMARRGAQPGGATGLDAR